jgi:hypothetical protein
MPEKITNAYIINCLVKANTSGKVPDKLRTKRKLRKYIAENTHNRTTLTKCLNGNAHYPLTGKNLVTYGSKINTHRLPASVCSNKCCIDVIAPFGYSRWNV